jgi:hypothetical protein
MTLAATIAAVLGLLVLLGGFAGGGYGPRLKRAWRWLGLVAAAAGAAAWLAGPVGMTRVHLVATLLFAAAALLAAGFRR